MHGSKWPLGLGLGQGGVGRWLSKKDTAVEAHVRRRFERHSSEGTSQGEAVRILSAMKERE